MYRSFDLYYTSLNLNKCNRISIIISRALIRHACINQSSCKSEENLYNVCNLLALHTYFWFMRINITHLVMFLLVQMSKQYLK